MIAFRCRFVLHDMRKKFSPQPREREGWKLFSAKSEIHFLKVCGVNCCTFLLSRSWTLQRTSKNVIQGQSLHNNGSGVRTRSSLLWKSTSSRRCCEKKMTAKVKTSSLTDLSGVFFLRFPFLISTLTPVKSRVWNCSNNSEKIELFFAIVMWRTFVRLKVRKINIAVRQK